MRFLAHFACAVMLTCFGALPGQAERRVALVIGNGDYAHADKLANPVTDARRLNEALKQLHFETVYGENLGKQELERAIGRFANTAQDSEVALVFYAGHGATFGDVPYVVPVDAQFSSLAQVPYELVPAETLIGELRRAKGVRIAILDACRDNAAERELKRKATRGGEVTRGLARVKDPEGLILAYATQYLSTAADGDPNGDSPYTAALLKHIGTPGLEVKALFFKVGREVIETTKGEQRPETAISIYDDYYLVPAGEASPVSHPIDRPPSPGPPQSEQAARDEWSNVKDLKSIPVLEDFIKRHSGTSYASLAQARVEELRRTPAAERTETRVPPVIDKPRDQLAVVVPPVRPQAPCAAGAVAVASVSSRTARPLSFAEECGLKPRDAFKECEKCPEMIVVPAGSYVMGSPANEEGHTKEEGPQHAVTIPKPFAVGMFAVTFDEFDACMADGGCNGYRPDDRGWGRGERPVINVSWDDATAYVAWLSRKTGKAYRLLAEAEREYAARAGTSSPFWWGNFISTGQANYNGTYVYGRGPRGEDRQRTLPVRSFEPNGFGLYQVHGNVWEWVEDCYHDGYTGAPSDGSAWPSANCAYHVVRGGPWSSNPKVLRAASRGLYPRESRGPVVGFRVARTL
jgi:formylglycine-generating enzyme required for sulfatase activity